MSDLYLSDMLVGWPADLVKSNTQTSEVRGGKYAARVQEGYEKDGSPKYRYFKTQEEYEAYMSGKGKGKKSKKKKDDEDGEKRLDEKREKERKESKKKQSALFTDSKKKNKEVETTKKGLVSLYLEVQS